MQKKRWTLPLALGLITAVLLILVLWPKENPTRTVVIAAQDLGAGQELSASDLQTVVMDARQAPADAVSNPADLVGQTLAVVRFTGEPITARHLGAAVTLSPTERGIALKVKADTGLAGLLRPGMQVGVVALRPDRQNSEVYAKAILEGLRVLYVSPDFVARAVAPATAATTVQGGQAGAPTATAGSTGTVREGVLLLAASTLPVDVIYAPMVREPISDTLTVGEPGALPPLESRFVSAATLPVLDARLPEFAVRSYVPVELLAALNAAGEHLTLVLLPQDPEPFTTLGASLSEVWPAPVGGVQR